MAAVTSRPARAAAGRRYSRVTWCDPPSTGMPTKPPSASTTGTDLPSTRAFQPGNQASATTTRAGWAPSTAIRHRPGPRRVGSTLVAEGGPAETGS